VKSFCRFCPVGCGVVVTVEDGRATAVRGDADHPVSLGYTCGKGRKLADWHYRSDRVHVPRLRGAEASAAECLDDIAATLRRIIAESGPAAVGFFRGTAASQDTAGLYVLERFKTALGTPSYFTSVTLDCAAYPLVADLVGGHPALHLPIPSRDAPLVLLIGSNPVVSHGHSYFTPSPAQMLRRWSANGQLWVIDPRRTESAAMATRYLAPRPGTDYALLAFLVREVLREGADWDYIREWTAGVDALAAAVAPFDLSRAAAITGLEPTELTDLVTAIRSCRRVAAVTGTGVSMSEPANVTVWLVWALNIITGSQDRPGVPALPELDVDTCGDEDVLALGTAGAGAGLGPRGIAGLPATAHLSNESAWSVVLGGEQFGWVHRALRRSGGKWRLAPGELIRQLRECDTTRRSLRLVVTREKGHVNSQFMTSSTARGAVNRPGVSINPYDAAAAGIGDGKTVLVESDHGRLVTTARLDERLGRGVVSIPHGYADDNVAQLCSEREIDPISGMATLTAIPVRVVTQDGER
jgi:anaerobic selenocysteine-containing dehydrogenase